MSSIAQSARALIALRPNCLLEGDSFRLSVILLILLSVAQRLIGLTRNVIFCGMLEDHELGRWSLINNFFCWAAPFVVIGLPGSFGRLSESYRQRGELRHFITKTARVCGVLAAVAAVFHMLAPNAIARLVFNDPQQKSIVMMLGAILPAVIAMNFVSEFLTSVRLTRAVALMQLASSLTFMLLGSVLLAAWSPNEWSLVLSFGGAAVVSTSIGLAYALPFLRALPEAAHDAPIPGFWQRLLPLAAWIWCANMAANLFDCADQFVLKHFTELPAITVDSMIGQLFASRIIPVLVVGMAGMIAGSLLPYLMKDSEVGKLGDVSQRIQRVMVYASIGFTLLAACTHMFSPVLFTWILRGRYDSGLELMPLAFVQYTWFSLCIIGNQYLICMDRPRLTTVPLFAGFIASATLTTILAPRFGLMGVVCGTATAHGLALLVLLIVCYRAGLRWNLRTGIACLLPLTMLLGGPACLVLTTAIAVINLRKE